MVLSIVTLTVALCLSMVAAWYSILGLTAIFAAAVIPIVIMGAILEVAKIVVTVWLHEYWHRCRLAMKLYLVPAVVMLMIITSMGIFGFLSKAHTDQSLVSGDVQSRIALYDEKIKIAKENIDANRRALKQLDEAVDQVMGRSTTETGAERSVQIRRQQGPERQRLIREIEAEQKKISQLNEERAPVAAEVRKVEAEVGPIKYIAALVYGDNPDANLLERAVRWVIVILVVVFDPLAIMMVLAATESFKWARQDTNAQYPPDDGALTADQLQQVQQSVTEPSLLERWPYLAQGAGMFFRNLRPHVAGTSEVPKTTEEDWLALDEQQKENIRRWKADNPGTTIKAQRDAFSAGRIDHLPWDPPLGQSRGFGAELPAEAQRGDTFVLTAQWPSTVFKYNGSKWILVDKSQSDQYAYEDQYIQHLIDSLAQNRLDPDLLSDAEREQIAAKLEKNHGQ